MKMVFERDTVKRLTVVLQIAVITFLCYLTLMPVENRWGQADVILIKTIPVLCVLGVLAPLLCKEKIYITAGDLLLLLFALYYGVHSYWGNDYPCSTQCIRLASVFLLYISLRLLFSGGRINQWILVAILLVCGSVEAIWGGIQMVGGNSARVYQVTGNFINPGPYSAYLAVGATIGLTILANNNKNKIVFVAVALILLVIPSTWSRAAIISVCLPLLWLFRERYYRYRFVIWGVLSLLACVFFFIKKGSAVGRLVIWTASLVSWRKSPLFGVGTGGFVHSCSEGIAEMYNNHLLPLFLNSAGVADNAFNLYLKILVEQGAVGLILFVVILVVFFKRLHSASRSLFYGLIALAIFSMFSYPLELLPYRIIAVTVMAWSESVRKQSFFFSGNRIIAVLTFCFTLVSGILIKNEAVDRYKADREAKSLSCQKGDDLLDDFYELLPFEKDNPRFLYDFATALSESGRLNESNTILNLGCKVSADPIFYILLGNNYNKMNQPNETETAYLKAFCVLPNRIYPLYQLMTFYSEKGQDEKALNMANEILEITPKVASPATAEMKMKAKNYLLK